MKFHILIQNTSTILAPKADEQVAKIAAVFFAGLRSFAAAMSQFPDQQPIFSQPFHGVHMGSIPMSLEAKTCFDLAFDCPPVPEDLRREWCLSAFAHVVGLMPAEDFMASAEGVACALNVGLFADPRTLLGDDPNPAFRVISLNHDSCHRTSRALTTCLFFLCIFLCFFCFVVVCLY
jgi:hypothetical protein